MPMPDYQPETLTRADTDALKGRVLLEFGANWCGHCIAAQAAIHEALQQHPALHHVAVEDGKGRPLGRSYQVKLWPTLILLQDGVELGRTVRPLAAHQVLALLAL
ncbi:thioredoxin family protein [Isoalcanivorax beigongshangi]|uniref:Thioredoxin family protein n=1 Tax=Isoalcanivorax beigongshangi TaxID=3238810 RepID=A0ABV4AFN3_9GAMM